MEVVLAAISAGGLVGASNQYLCLLIIALAARWGWFDLGPRVEFMTSIWFIGLVGLFWILTVAPAYLALILPGIMNSVNTVINFLSGFVVPASAAILSLASAGVIVGLDPELQQMLQTLGLFNPEGGLDSAGVLVAGGGAATATSLTFMKFLTKPALSTATGTVGTASAPIYATLENIASVVLMGLLYVLLNVNPWLLVILFAVVFVIFMSLMLYGLYLLWKLGKGIGRLIRLIEVDPKAGWSVVAEFFIWGSGWLIWKKTKRGAVMIGVWLVFGLVWWGLFGVAALLPILLIIYLPLSLLLFTLIGVFSARALLYTFDIPEADLPLEGMPSLGTV